MKWWASLDPLAKKIFIAVAAVMGTVFTMGSAFADYRDLPEKVSNNTEAIHENAEAIERSDAKLDAVLCILVQDQLTPEGEELNPLLCLNGNLADAASFLPGSPGY